MVVYIRQSLEHDIVPVPRNLPRRLLMYAPFISINVRSGE